MLGTMRAGTMRLAILFAGFAAIAMMLGLMRWPVIHWALTGAYESAGREDRLVIAAIFDGLNTYRGNYLCEFLGELTFSKFFLLTGIVWLQTRAGARLLPVCMIVLGVALARIRPETSEG